MKKKIRTILCLLLVLALSFQYTGSLALADVDANISGRESLVYELRLSDSGSSDQSSPVSAEEEGERLGGRAYTIAVGSRGASPSDPSNAPLSRTASGIVLDDLLSRDLIIAPPEGYFVSRVYLRGDEVSSQELKDLPFTADAASAKIVLQAGAVANSSNSFDKKYLSTAATADPSVYTLTVVLAPIGSCTVTEAMGAGEYGSETSVGPGSAYTVPYAPADSEQRVFSHWKLSYRNGATLRMDPGQSFVPYGNCRLEAQWTQVITVTANAPYESDGQFYTNGWTYTGSLAYGDNIDSVTLNVMEQADGFVAVPSDAYISRNGENVTGSYILRYENSQPVQKAAAPDPTPVYLTITANAPVTYDGGQTYVPDSAALTEGMLNPGDSFDSIQIDIQRNEDGSYIAVPRDAVISNAGIDVSSNYIITYLPSQPVMPPVPEPVKLTITANPPVTNDGGKTYVPDSAVLTEGSLNAGDSFQSIEIDVIMNEDGNYVAIPRDAVIGNGYTVTTEDYEITYLPSEPVTPMPVEKVKLTVTANAPILGEDGKTFIPDSAVLTEGSLNAGDSFQSLQIDILQNENGDYYAMPRDAVIMNAGFDVTADYEITYLPSESVTPPPAEKVKITVTANPPITNDGGRTYVPNSAMLTDGTLNPGDSFDSLQIDVQLNEDGTYVAVPRDAVIVNAGVDVTENYEITYAASETVTPEKIKLSFTANAPILGEDGKTFVSNGALLSDGTLNYGDELDSVQVDVLQNEEGNYYAMPRDAVIVNAGFDVTDYYEITYLPSESVTPPPAEKVKLTVTANEPITNDGGRTYVPNSAILTEGTLNPGDSFNSLQIDITRNEDGSYVAVPRDAVIVNAGVDVTEDYEITYVPSQAVTPEKIKISITANAPVPGEDGKTFVSDGAILSEGTLNSGDELGSVQADVLQNGDGNYYAMPRDAVIVNAGVDVTEYYEITYLPSEAVTPPPAEKVKLTITANEPITNDGGKTYVPNSALLTEGALNPGDSFDNIQIDINKNEDGTYVAVPRDAVIVNGYVNVTDDYEITYVPSAPVTPPAPDPVKLTVSVQDQKWTYDGSSRKPDPNGYTVAGLTDGDTANVQLQLKQGDSVTEDARDAGTYTIVPVITILDRDGAPVAEEKYNIEAGSGTLTVAKLEISVEAESDSKPYDGSALVNDKVKAPSLPAGLQYKDIKLEVYDSKGNLIRNGVTEIGVYTKKIVSVLIVDAEGQDVSANFSITTVDGTLTVTTPQAVKLTITAKEPVTKDEGKTYVDDGYEITEGSLTPGDSIDSVQIDVKQTEDGNYIAVPRAAVIVNGYIDNTANYDITYVSSKPVTPVVPEKVKLTITAKEPVTKDGGKTYVANSAILSEGSLRTGDSFDSIQIDVNKNEDGTYVAVPRDAVIVNGYINVTEDYEITYVASAPVKPADPEKVKLTITAKEPITKDGGKTYVPNSALLSEGRLNPGDAFTALEFDIKQNEDGSYVSIPRDAVIKNGDKVTTEDYDITYVPSKSVMPEQEKISITVRSKDRTAEYSGKLITADEYVLVVGALAEGDTMEVTYTGGSTNITASPIPSVISSVVIKDAQGNDVTATKYAVTIDNDNAGKVTVTKRVITVTAISGSVETDGTKVIYAKDCKTANGVFNKGHKVEGLLEGHELRGDFVKGYGTETFTTSIDLNELRIVDTANNLDVTANYDVKTVNGTMTIKVTGRTGVPVVVTVKDQSWTYDGTAHTPNISGVEISGLLDGDVASITLSLKQGDRSLTSATNAGTYTIVPQVLIRTKDGAAVPDNKYSINIIGASGTLTVKKMDITLEAVSDSKPYDGKALVNDKVKAPALPAGQKYQGVKLNVFDTRGNLIRNGVKEVGTYTKKITEVHIVDANGIDVTDNYNITKVDGKLTITSSSMNNSTSPKTGDDSKTGFIVAIIISAVLLIAIAIVFILLGKRNRLQPEPDPDYVEPDPVDPDMDWTAPAANTQTWDAAPAQGWEDSPTQAWNPAAPQTSQQSWSPSILQNWDAAPDANWDAAPQQDAPTSGDPTWDPTKDLFDEEPKGNWSDQPAGGEDEPPVHIPKH